ARQELEQAQVDVSETQRFTAPGPLGHNKFFVRTNASGSPLVAWTGSTNWTPTGLCTQVNNGLLVQDPQVAEIYMAQWQRLRSAGNESPASLVNANSQPKPVGADTPGQTRSVVWFTRTRDAADMAALSNEVKKAKQGILFLMFMPGASGLFSVVATS